MTIFFIYKMHRKLKMMTQIMFETMVTLELHESWLQQLVVQSHPNLLHSSSEHTSVVSQCLE